MAIITISNGRLSVKNLNGDQLPDLPSSRPGRKYWDLTVKSVILADPDLGPFLVDVTWDAATGSAMFTKSGPDGTDILAASTPWNGDEVAWRGELKKLKTALDKFLDRCKVSSEWRDIVPDTTGFCLPDISEREYYRRCVLPDGSRRLVVIWGLKVGEGRKDVKFIVDNPPQVVEETPPTPAPQPPPTTPPKSAQPPLTLTDVKITRPSPDTSRFEAVPDIGGVVYSFVVTDKSKGAAVPQKVSIKGCIADVQLPAGAYSLQVRAFQGSLPSNTLQRDFVVATPKTRGKFWYVPWLILLLLLIAVGAFFALRNRPSDYTIPYVAEYDTNRNGQLEETEKARLIKDYDSNGDGKIDAVEGKRLDEDLKSGEVSSVPYSVKHDTNNDGKIDGIESPRVLAAYDRDENGVIDTEERKALEDENKKLVAADKQLKENSVPYLIIFDTDGDEKLSKAERDEALKQHDKDGDHVLNLYEIRIAEIDKKGGIKGGSTSQESVDTAKTNATTPPLTTGDNTTNIVPPVNTLNTNTADNGNPPKSASPMNTSKIGGTPSPAVNGGTPNDVPPAGTSNTNKTTSSTTDGNATNIVPPVNTLNTNTADNGNQPKSASPVNASKIGGTPSPAVNGGTPNGVPPAGTSNTNKTTSSTADGNATDVVQPADTSNTNTVDNVDNGKTPKGTREKRGVSRPPVTAGSDKQPSGASGEHGKTPGDGEWRGVVTVPTFDFVIEGEPKRNHVGGKLFGKHSKFDITFKLTGSDPEATYTLTLADDGRKWPFEDDKVTVPMKAGERKVMVQEKKGDRSYEKSHLIKLSDKGIETITKDKGVDVKFE